MNNNRKIFVGILVFGFFSWSVIAHNYIHGNGFRACADYLVESDQYCSFNPETILPKSIIYVESNFLNYFFSHVFSRITVPIIMISHNSDWPAPSKFACYLDDPRMIMWFGQNCDINHAKFYPIPIGIANPRWEHGNPHVFDAVLDHLERQIKREKISKLYINFSPTHPDRSYLCNLLKKASFASFASPKSIQGYLLEIAQYKFILSPFGNGLDCHRTWEALLMGTIPVVKTSTLDPLYADLPVIIVHDWNEISEKLLESQYQCMTTKTYNRKKLFMPYWIDLIRSYKHAGA